jgi:Cdc6-like AAA superfamily ATPase
MLSEDKPADSTGWEGFIRKVLAEDIRAQAQIESEHLDPEAVVSIAVGLAGSETSLDMPARFTELEQAQERRAAALSAHSDEPLWLAVVTVIATISILAGIIGGLALLAILIGKWTGHLAKVPLAPYVVISGTGFSTGVSILGVVDFVDQARSRKGSLSQSALAAERFRSNLAEQVVSLLIIPALERAAAVQFVEPNKDVVKVTEATHMSARVEPTKRIQTSSYRRVLLNLRRAGGATIGLAGSRGVGKSELLRSFCDHPFERASIESGGTIGIVVAAPVVYEPQPFIRLIIRRLAENVPRDDAATDQRPRWIMSATDFATFAAIMACLAPAMVLLGGLRVYGRLIGWMLLVLALVLAAVWGKYRFYNNFWRNRRRVLDWLRRSSPERAAQQQSARIEEYRKELGVRASEVVQRVRYLETRSTGSELSVSAGKVGLKSSAGLSLGQIPYTEADLVEEFERLVAELHYVGYNVTVGIDELDKLVTGDRAEEFLNGIKVLFAARDCSFILTVSDNAFAQFARRGMPVRDVFDSSLDDVVWVEHLTFLEARRLSRARLSQGQTEEMSDTQLLVCHCLSGGLPRDFLRYARQLGELNSRRSGSYNHFLGELLPELLTDDLRVRLNGVTSALRGRDDGPLTAPFIAELDGLAALDIKDGTAKLRTTFLASDSSFEALVQPSETWVRPPPTDILGVTESASWIQNTRRQLLSYIYFADTVREVFLTPEVFSAATDRPDEGIALFERLAEARRRLEIDPAAGWRSVNDARRHFQLAG